MASIRVLSEAGEEQFPLEVPVVTLGRGLESDVRLKDIKASRRHCQIVRVPEGFQVVDLSSGNGTYVNGVQVKQQRLEPGDKIQIGSTTITFHDAPPAPAPERKAAPPGGGSAPRLEAAPAAAPSPKPAAASNSAIPAVARSPLEGSSKSLPAPTRRLGAVRGSGSTRSGPKASAEEGSKPGRKSSPALLIVAAIGVVFAGVVGAILFSGSGDSGEQLAATVKRLGDEARAAEKAGRYDDADAKYRAILARIEGKDRFRGDVVRINDARKELGERKVLLSDAPRRFNDLKGRAATAKEEEAAGLAREARQLLSDAGESPFEWIKELRDLADRLDRQAEAAGGGKRNDFSARRAEIALKCGLETDAPRYGEAIAEWQSYSAGKHLPDESRAKAVSEIAALQQRAKGDLEKLKARASGLEKENRKAEALEELKKQRGRFKGTGSADDLEGAITQLEK